MASTSRSENPSSNQLETPSTEPQTTAESPTSNGWVETVTILFVYGLVVAVAMRPILGFDIWWHMATGRWIVEHGQIPWTDPFSAYGQDKTWIAYSWLFELIVYGVHSLAGLTGILLFRTTICLAIAASLHRLIATFEPRPLFAAVYLLPFLGMMWPLYIERPWLVTVLFSVWTMQVIVDLRRGHPNQMTWWLPVIYVIWTNLHIQVVYGYCFLVLGCVSPFIDSRLGQQGGNYAARPKTPEWWRLLQVTALCMIAFFVTPYHFYLPQVVVTYATQKAPVNLITEMKAMQFRTVYNWITLAVALLSAFCLGRRRFSTFELLILVGSCYFCFRSRRDVWMLSLVGAIIIPATFHLKSASSIPMRFTWLHKGVLIVGLLLWTGFLIIIGGANERELQEMVAKQFPKAAVEWIKENNPKGPLYNSYDWGGYIIWNLNSSELPVAIDGRANLHGGKRMVAFLRTYRGEPKWDEDSEFLSARLLLLERHAPVVQLLKADRRYELVYDDDHVVVFRKVSDKEARKPNET